MRNSASGYWQEGDHVSTGRNFEKSLTMRTSASGLGQEGGRVLHDRSFDKSCVSGCGQEGDTINSNWWCRSFDSQHDPILSEVELQWLESGVVNPKDILPRQDPPKKRATRQWNRRERRQLRTMLETAGPPPIHLHSKKQTSVSTVSGLMKCKRSRRPFVENARADDCKPCDIAVTTNASLETELGSTHFPNRAIERHFRQRMRHRTRPALSNCVTRKANTYPQFNWGTSIKKKEPVAACRERESCCECVGHPQSGPQSRTTCGQCPEVGKRSAEETVQSEIKPQKKRPKKDGTEIRAEFVPRAAGPPPYVDTTTQQKLEGIVRATAPSAPAAPSYVDRTTQMSLTRYATAADAGTDSAAAVEISTPRKGRKSPFTPAQQEWLRSKYSGSVPAAQEMRLILLPRAQADGILDVPPPEDKSWHYLGFGSHPCFLQDVRTQRLTAMHCIEKQR